MFHGKDFSNSFDFIHQSVYFYWQNLYAGVTDHAFLAIKFDLRYYTWKTNDKAIAIEAVEWWSVFKFFISISVMLL